jgi:hypothetical protein
VADFAPTGTAQELDFAHAEWREVVVQHKTLELVLLEEQVKALHVFLGAQRERGERLRFSSCKERGAMNAREQAHFAGNLANLVEGAAIGTPAGVQDVVAEDILAQAFKSALGKRALLVHLFLRLLGNGGEDFLFQGIDQVIAFLLWMLLGIERVVQPVAVFLLQILVDAFVEGKRLDGHFLGLELAVKLLNSRDDLPDLCVAEFESIGNRFLGNLERAGLHHDDGFFGAGDDDVQQALLLLSNGGVGDELPIEQADPDTGNGLLKRQVGSIAGG